MNRSFSLLARYLGLMLAVSAGAALGGCGSSAPLFLSDGRPTTLVECPAGSGLLRAAGGRKLQRRRVRHRAPIHE